MTDPKTVQIQPEQIQRAAQAGLKLLNDDERVNISPSLALSGDFAILNGMLQALASGQAVLGNPEKPLAPPVKIPGDDSQKE